MKIARLFVLASLAFTGCSSPPEPKDRNLVSKEVYSLSLGNEEVYAVRMHLTTDQPVEALGAKVSLLSDTQTWVDTLYLDLQQNDTVETEAIFSQALKKKYTKVHADIEFFPL